MSYFNELKMNLSLELLIESKMAEKQDLVQKILMLREYGYDIPSFSALTGMNISQLVFKYELILAGIERDNQLSTVKKRKSCCMLLQSTSFEKINKDLINNADADKNARKFAGLLDSTIKLIMEMPEEVLRKIFFDIYS